MFNLNLGFYLYLKLIFLLVILNYINDDTDSKKGKTKNVLIAEKKEQHMHV